MSIRAGLEKLGVEAVRRAVAAGALERTRPNGPYKGCMSFTRCFLYHALEDSFVASLRCTQDPDICDISSAHVVGDPRLADEVMIYLAEHGDAVEPTLGAKHESK